MDITALTRAASGVDLDKVEGIPHEITLPHKVTAVPAEQRFDRFIARRAADAIKRYHAAGAYVVPPLCQCTRSRLLSLLLLISTAEPARLRFALALRCRRWVYAHVGHPFGISVGFADPSPPYVALRALYDQHFADPASALSESVDADDGFAEGDSDDTPVASGGFSSPTLAHNATNKEWHAAVAAGLRRDAANIRRVRSAAHSHSFGGWVHPGRVPAGLAAQAVTLQRRSRAARWS